jgi:hypothetical protein
LSQPIRAVPSTERWVGLGFAFLALTVGPILLALLVLGAKFQGLRDPVAMDHAQLAAHVAAGEGFVTSAVRPLSLVFKADLDRPPDLYHGPAHPYLLALCFRLFAPSDKVAASTGAALWVLSCWLTFLIARYWFGTRVAALAAILYTANVAALAAAIGGLPHPLAAVLLLLPAWRLLLAGVACGLLALTHPLLATVGVVVGLSLTLGAARRSRALGLFLIGFFNCLIPWMVRSWRLTGSPLFSLYLYEALSRTREYPGDVIWRMTEAPETPLVFLLRHPLQVFRKLLAGLAEFRSAGLTHLDAVVTVLVLASLLVPQARGRWRPLAGVAVGSAALFVFASALLRPEPGLLVAWAPLFCILAAQALVAWLKRAMPAPAPDPEAWADEKARRLWIWRGRRFAATGGVLALAALPLAYYLVVARPGPDPQLRHRLAALEQLPSGAIVLTDQPVLVAWCAGRRALWLPQREADLDVIERTFGPLQAAYVTPGVRQLPDEERGDWWYWLSAPGGRYRGLAVADPMTPEGVLRVQQP